MLYCRQVMECFKWRNDNQITSLEILSIAFGACTYVHPRICSLMSVCWAEGISVFGDMLANRRVYILIDYNCAHHNTEKGRARSFDHTCLIHGIWFVICSSLSLPSWFYFGLGCSSGPKHYYTTCPCMYPELRARRVA